MGYINRDKEPAPRDFEEQFQWDGHSWVFRRFHRGRPVRVTVEEMEQSISSYRGWKKGLVAASVIGAILAVLLLDQSNDPGRQALGPVHALIATAMFPMLEMTGHRWIWRKAIKRFANRVPVGASLSWIEDRLMLARDTSWSKTLLPVAAIGVSAAFIYWVSPVGQLSPLLMGAAALVGLVALADVVLKLKAGSL